MSEPIQLIVGLGNPGAEYKDTRHNVGAWFVDQLATELDKTLRMESKFAGFFAASVLPFPLKLLIPTTFMNESGRALALITKFYKIPPEAIVIVHDELDFPVGKTQLKNGGGHGGHNGLRDITKALGSPDFWRIRLGIGHPGHKDRVSPYVLSAPNKQDKQLMEESIVSALHIVPLLCAGKFSTAMNQLNGA